MGRRAGALPARRGLSGGLCAAGPLCAHRAAQAEPATTGEGAFRVVPLGSALPTTPEPVAPKRSAHYLWAVLIARIYEVFPLLCPMCGAQMRLIASQSPRARR